MDTKEKKFYSAEEVQELVKQNREILSEFAAFRSSMAGGERRGSVAREIKQRTCTIMFIDDKPVIGLKNKGTDKRPMFLYEKQDPNRKNSYFLYADVKLYKGVKEDGTYETEVITLDWNEFLENADRAECKIVKAEKIPWIIKQGTTLKQTVDPDYKVEVEGPVDVVVEGSSQMLTIQLPTGDTVNIDEAYVNIAK